MAVNPRNKGKAWLVAEVERLQQLLEPSGGPALSEPRSAISGEASPELLRTIIESLDVAIVVVDPQGVIRFTSGQLAELSLLSETPTVGSRFSDTIELLDPIGAHPGEIRAALLESSPGERQVVHIHDGRVIECTWLPSSSGSLRI